MFASLINLFFPPAECTAPDGHPPVVAPTPPIPRAPRPALTAVEVTVSEAPDGQLIRIKGEARVDCAGTLLDGLLAAAARRPAVVTLDLSELRFISSLAMGVLVSYRRGVVRTGGRVRLAEELQPAVKEALARAELLDLFETTADSAAPGGQDVLTPRPERTPVAV